MPSLISHAVVALGLGTAFYTRGGNSRSLLLAGALCSMAPDIDVIGFRFGVPYGAFWGHRGFTHSLLFALILSALVCPLLCRNQSRRAFLPSWLFLFLATASHGALDAFTNGGLGVAFLSPFDTSRYFFPWRPILVSPIGVSRFFSQRGVAVLQSEFLYLWIPTILFVALVFVLRTLSRPRPAS
jgi:inner membrane protein